MKPLAKVFSVVGDPEMFEKPQDRCVECNQIFNYVASPDFRPEDGRQFPQAMLSRLAWKPISHSKCEAAATERKRQEAESRKRRDFAQMLKLSGFPENIHSKTFESFFVTDDSKREFELVRKWRPSDRFGFWLQGPPGTGKTHLMGSFVHRYFQACGDQVPKMVWWSVPFLFDRITKDFAREDRSEPTFNGVLKADVLFLDDLGTQQGKAWENERLFQILDSRLSADLPTFVTTNLSPEELQFTFHERIVSRLMGLCVPIKLKSKDMRHEIFAGRVKDLLLRKNL